MIGLISPSLKVFYSTSDTDVIVFSVVHQNLIIEIYFSFCLLPAVGCQFFTLRPWSKNCPEVSRVQSKIHRAILWAMAHSLGCLRQQPPWVWWSQA